MKPTRQRPLTPPPLARRQLKARQTSSISGQPVSWSRWLGYYLAFVLLLANSLTPFAGALAARGNLSSIDLAAICVAPTNSNNPAAPTPSQHAPHHCTLPQGCSLPSLDGAAGWNIAPHPPQLQHYGKAPEATAATGTFAFHSWPPLRAPPYLRHQIC